MATDALAGGMARHPRSRPAPGFRRGKRIADSMTAEHHEHVRRSAAAERAGDAHAAAEWHVSVPMFRRGQHASRLRQLAWLGEQNLPEWVWARWIFYQLTRCEDGASGRELARCRSHFTQAVHADLLDECYLAQGDPMRVIARALGESWLLHQVQAHELGLLDEFLSEHAAGELAKHTELARSWEGAPMGAYRMGQSLPGARLEVYPVDGSTPLEVLDLGARAVAGVGGHVLGRLVPSGVGDLLMFDMAPVSVAADLAAEVRADDEFWLRPIVARLGAGESSSRWLLEDYELTTDIRQMDLLRLGTEPRDLARVTEQLRDGRDEVSRAAHRVLRRAAEGGVDPVDQAVVAAAAQIPAAVAEARQSFVRDSQAACWEEWAELATEPGRSQLLGLARVARE